MLGPALDRVYGTAALSDWETAGAEAQGTCKTAVALLISGRSLESLTTEDVLSYSTSVNASSSSPTSSEAARESMSSCCQSALVAP
ncbi:UNVERIFIED_CONTAM: hypothetical protein FKN15_061975 [Acipenser sinensis]